MSYFILKIELPIKKMMVWLGYSLVFMANFHIFGIKMWYNLYHSTLELVEIWNLN